MSGNGSGPQGGATDNLKSLWPLYIELRRYEFTSPARAYQMFSQMLDEFQEYTGAPDLWHNLAMVAGKVDHEDAQMRIVQVGLRDWPDNVDLLCDELLYFRSTHYNLDKARQIWEQLSKMDRRQTAPYWRFWAYGAIYHALDLNDPSTALKLLDDGLRSVRRDSLMDILRHYRRVLVDGGPREQLQGAEQIKQHQHDALNLLESRYRLGIELGVENGYVLAIELATLYQERAGAGSETITIGGERGELRRAQNAEYLNAALTYLDLAETLYTGNSNHPVWEIYETRARILMAQHKYGDALRLLRSLPQARLEDPSVKTMLKLASLSTGEKLDDDNDGQVVGMTPQRVLNDLFENEGAHLVQLARDNPQIPGILIQVLRRLQADEK